MKRTFDLLYKASCLLLAAGVLFTACTEKPIDNEKTDQSGQTNHPEKPDQPDEPDDPDQHYPEVDYSSAIDLSSSESSNCYIVSEGGVYKFKAVKGNSSASLGEVASVSTLWETDGTADVLLAGDLVFEVRYEDGYVAFKTADGFKEGNAVVAAKDASGNILWSWHLWFTDEPKGQVYHNEAGSLMDRNLGATSATPGEVGSLGLLYQWGRKDPFLGSASISSHELAQSTAEWPESVVSSEETGTVAYAVANPMTFITMNSYNKDWYFDGEGSTETDNTRWEDSSHEKTIYDPCPAGWRIPDNIWGLAADAESSSIRHTFDETNMGMNLSGVYGDDSTIWYPASGGRDGDKKGELADVAVWGEYWAAVPTTYPAHTMKVNYDGYVDINTYANRAHALSVRCIKD
jgi:hypothetical protein